MYTIIDLVDAPQSVIDELHDDGRIVVSYFSAGSYWLALPISPGCRKSSVSVFGNEDAMIYSLVSSAGGTFFSRLSSLASH
jgi:hypothetical protein